MKPQLQVLGVFTCTSLEVCWCRSFGDYAGLCGWLRIGRWHRMLCVAAKIGGRSRLELRRRACRKVREAPRWGRACQLGGAREAGQQGAAPARGRQACHAPGLCRLLLQACGRRRRRKSVQRGHEAAAAAEEWRCCASAGAVAQRKPAARRSCQHDSMAVALHHAPHPKNGAVVVKARLASVKCEEKPVS